MVTVPNYCNTMLGSYTAHVSAPPTVHTQNQQNIKPDLPRFVLPFSCTSKEKETQRELLSLFVEILI